MMPRRWMAGSVAVLLAGLAAAAVPARLAAQQPDARLAGRLDARTAAAVTALVDSAHVAGLPDAPLVNKALEGASKGASGERIVAVVRDLEASLAAARRALGPGASESELVAGAAALRAGVGPAVLAQLRRGPHGGSVLVPLAVMADLVARGVPADTAAQAVLALERSGARDADMVAFRESVERDIALGAPAGASAATRTLDQGGLTTNAGAPSTPGTATQPPRKP